MITPPSPASPPPPPERVPPTPQALVRKLACWMGWEVDGTLLQHHGTMALRGAPHDDLEGPPKYHAGMRCPDTYSLL